ncbi:hypothetical protein D3C85_1119350 [compost metagenome]
MRSSSRALAKACRCDSNFCERHRARKINTRAVTRLVARSMCKRKREPSPRASLNALAAGVTRSLMAWICCFQRTIWASLATPRDMPWCICRATSSSCCKYSSPTVHSLMAVSR